MVARNKREKQASASHPPSLPPSLSLMAFLQSPPTQSLLRLPFLCPKSSSLPIHSIKYPKKHRKSHPKRFSLPFRLSPNALPASDQPILDFISGSSGGHGGGGAETKNLPAVRTYENDLARLTVIGDVALEQALTAAAADGGDAAEEHLASGMSTMVVETVSPGKPEEHSTVSTRLAYWSLRTIVMKGLFAEFKHLWSFELVLFSPGTERNMEDLANPREVPARFTLSSSDSSVLSAIAEVVCLCALETTETIVENAKKMIGNFNSVKRKYGTRKARKDQWWAPPAYAGLEKLGGPEFCTWANDYIPAYRLQINADNFKNVKFEGWQKSADNRWEVLLTHFQMVGLADILDLYYEDFFTIPNKQLTSGLVTEIPKLSNNKKSSLSRVLFISVVSGCLLLALGILGQLRMPYLFKARRSLANHHVVSSSEVDGCLHQPVETPEMEALCTSVVKRIRDALGWSGEVTNHVNMGAWTGEIPSYLKRLVSINLVPDAASASEGTTADSHGADLSDGEVSVCRNDSDMQMLTAQGIASYQVVLTRDGKVIGFQPTSRVAVNHWASNPLAKALYRGRKLSPGFLEPGLSIPSPNEAIEVELLMSVDPNFQFAWARPVRLYFVAFFGINEALLSNRPDKACETHEAIHVECLLRWTDTMNLMTRRQWQSS
ncbi:hypothetical protein ACLOJK_010408 [Asimina triloba]